MNCPESDLLAAWIEGSLPAKERSRLAAHLAGCDACRRVLALAGVALDSKPAPIEADAVDRWLRRLSRPGPAIWSYAAAAGVLIAVGFLLFARLRPAGKVELPAPPVVKKEPASTEREKTDVPRPRDEREPERVAKRTKAPSGGKPEEVREEPKKDETAKRTGETKADLSGLFEPISVLDGTGDLWVRRGEEAARVEGSARTGYGQVLESRSGAASFTLDGAATVAIEAQSRVWVARSKRERAYVLGLEVGPAFVDTEGASQSWHVLGGALMVMLPAVRGRIYVESGEEAVQIHVLQGRVESPAAQQTVEAGRSIEIRRRGGALVTEEDAAAVKTKLRRLKEVRPLLRTVFLATFDDDEGARPFAYDVGIGARRRDATARIGQCMRAETPTGAMVAKCGPKAAACVGLLLSRSVAYLTGMELRFKYRTDSGQLVVRAGKHEAVVRVQPTRGQWKVGEAPLDILQDQGVPIVSGDAIDEIFIGLPKDAGGSCTLDVDDVELVRSARFVK
ncbi:MAG: zf-HC2 domain-containing protein [Planctomycetes bacterium]|nr:zf-HC2 domain-containing protein [Planctomycetota bacterium]